MSSGLDGCSHIVDTRGLLAIADMGTNEKAAFKAALKDGSIAVPSVVWREFEDLYEEEAAELEPYITKKIRIKPAYNVGAASIADSAGTMLTQGPYDSHADLFTASICQIEGRTLLTSEDQAPYYKKLQCCSVIDLDDWLSAENE